MFLDGKVLASFSKFGFGYPSKSAVIPGNMSLLQRGVPTPPALIWQEDPVHDQIFGAPRHLENLQPVERRAEDEELGSLEDGELVKAEYEELPSLEDFQLSGLDDFRLAVSQDFVYYTNQILYISHQLHGHKVYLNSTCLILLITFRCCVPFNSMVQLMCQAR